VNEPARLSEREAAALLALAALNLPMTGPDLALNMRTLGRNTSTAAAHQAGVALARKGLVFKSDADRHNPVRYRITEQGRTRVTDETAVEPITLSMPRTAPGEASIRARGKDLDVIVGDVVRSGSKWRATLWCHPGQQTCIIGQFERGSLKELREFLEQRIRQDGPWWS
jgi:transposase